MKTELNDLLIYLEEINYLHALLVGDPEVLHRRTKELAFMDVNLKLAINLVKGMS